MQVGSSSGYRELKEGGEKFGRISDSVWHRPISCPPRCGEGSGELFDISLHPLVMREIRLNNCFINNISITYRAKWLKIREKLKTPADLIRILRKDASQ
jgi:hypothetical protein